MVLHAEIRYHVLNIARQGTVVPDRDYFIACLAVPAGKPSSALPTRVVQVSPTRIVSTVEN
jgi:hypothetical protein